MRKDRYYCPWCHYESEILELCPNCRLPLLIRCPVCGNPIAGMHVCQWSESRFKADKEAVT